MREPLSKGESTRQRIIAQAATVFNEKGYAGTSIADVMAATGLRKGGIYNHFAGKDDLALAVFDHAFEQVGRYLGQQTAQAHTPLEKIIAFIEAFAVYEDEQIIAGGCPLMNTAIEADDSHPALRERVTEAFDIWRAILQRRLEKAIAQGEARPDVDISAFVTLVIASLEGGVMLARLYRNPACIHQVIRHLLNVIERDIRMPNP